MKRRLVALALICIATISTVIIYHILSPSPTGTTILEIVFNPESWANKKVKVDGTIIGPLIYIPEIKPPYNYLLQDKDNLTVSIGVKHSGETLENSPYVTVTGTVKAGYTEGLIGGDLVYYIEAERIESIETYEEIEGHSHTCFGDLDELTTPCSRGVDGNWVTKVEWNTTHLGDFNVYFTQNFTISGSASDTKFRLKAYHRNSGSLMPTPMEISYWNGFSWKQLYALDDQDYRNEVFVEMLDIPAEAFLDGKISIKTCISYSSHVTGLGSAQQLWHYVEYFEGKMILFKGD